MNAASKPKVVCLVGSTRFFTEFLQAQYEAELAGIITVGPAFTPSVNPDKHGGDVGVTPEQKAAIDNAFIHKIAMADEILVINSGGYIGRSTRKDIEFARRIGKPIQWIEPQHIARENALRFHANQRYGDQPYSVHLEDVIAILKRYGLATPVMECVGWSHDLLEDTEATRGTLVDIGLPARAIELVELVTDEPGANRAERRKKTYPKIAADRDAVVLKLCDRIANVERRAKIEMYAKEHAEFRAALFNPEHKLDVLWNDLDALIAQHVSPTMTHGNDLEI